jgi:hypothetical protein
MIEEITKELTFLTENKKDWRADLIAKSIINIHVDEFNNESIFVEYNLYENVKRLVTQVISKLASSKPEIENLQLIMPGFEHLQCNYMIDGVGVHIDNMSDAQIDERAKFYDASARSMSEHAQELREYKNRRNNG